MGEVEWVALVGLVVKIGRQFELWSRVYAEGRRKKMVKQGEVRCREIRGGGSRAGEEEKRDMCKLPVCPSLLSFIYFWSKLINT